MQNTLMGLPVEIWAVICLAVAVIYFNFWPRPPRTATVPRTAWQQLVLRWFHSLTWLFLAFAALSLKFVGVTAAQEEAWTKYAAAIKETADARKARRESIDRDAMRNMSPEDHRKFRDSMWEQRRKELREQVLVSQGLWPMPEKTPLNPVVHGKVERDGYTIEKVFFASTPGHYVSGNLYRPLPANPDRKGGGDAKLPGVLFAHGHWKDGRVTGGSWAR